MLDRAFRLSSNWYYFSEECDRLKLLFSRLKYPDNLVNNTILPQSPAVSDRSDPIRVVLLFKDQSSTEIVLAQLKDLNQKLQTTVQPVFVSQKIGRGRLSTNSALFTDLICDLCDAGYVGFTRRHLHQCVEKHKNSSSSLGKHLRNKHSLAPKYLTKNLSVLMKSTIKFDCLVYEMFLFTS